MCVCMCVCVCVCVCVRVCACACVWRETDRQMVKVQAPWICCLTSKQQASAAKLTRLAISVSSSPCTLTPDQRLPAQWFFYVTGLAPSQKLKEKLGVGSGRGEEIAASVVLKANALPLGYQGGLLPWDFQLFFSSLITSIKLGCKAR